jgi:hypothetical protein
MGNHEPLQSARILMEQNRVLLHLGAGIGNIVLATPLLVALNQLGFEVDVALAADYPEAADLLRPWSTVRTVFANGYIPPAKNYDYVLPAIPPFYWPRFAHRFCNTNKLLARPPDALFYQNEQAFYLSFAQTLGWRGDTPFVSLPIAPTERTDVTRRTLVLGPGKWLRNAGLTFPHWLRRSTMWLSPEQWTIFGMVRVPDWTFRRTSLTSLGGQPCGTPLRSSLPPERSSATTAAFRTSLLRSVHQR